MNGFLQWTGYFELLVCAVALSFIAARQQMGEYWALASFLAVRVASSISTTILIHEVDVATHQMRHSLYADYFYIYWGAFAIESIAATEILYSVLVKIVGPLKGLRILGTLAILVAFGLSYILFSVSATSTHPNGLRFLIALVEQLQTTQSILTLCLLLFIGFAARPLGLSYRSRVFGVSLGLSAMASANLVVAAFSHGYMSSALLDAVDAVTVCVAFSLVAIYFAMREPERGDLQLTPALQYWNRKGMALLS